MKALLRWLVGGALALSTSCTLQPHTLILWHTLDGEHERAVLALVDRWNQSPAAAFIVVPERRTHEQQHRALMQGFAQKRVPDLVLVAPEQLAIYAQQNQLVALETFINNADPTLGLSPTEREAFFPFVLTAGRWNEQLFGVPQGGQMRLAFVNQLRLQEVQGTQPNPEPLPNTTAALMSLCAAASDFALGRACFVVTSEAITLEEWALAHGASLGGGTIPTINTPATRNALNTLLEQVSQFRAVRVRTEAEAEQLFAEGELLFITAWSGRARNIAQRVRAAENFPLSITVLPSENGSARAPFRAPLWVIPRTTSAREQRAWRFVRWLLEAPQSAAYATQTSDLPARRDALPRMSEAALLGVPLAPQNLARLLDAATPTPPRPAQGCIDRVLTKALLLSLSSGEIEVQLNEAQAELQQLGTRYCPGEALTPAAQTVAR